MFIHQIYVIFFLLANISSMQITQGTKLKECKCVCPSQTGESVCEQLEDIRLEIDANTGELKKWSQFFPFVQYLKNKWREEIISIVATEMKKYSSEGSTIPKPENLVAKLDDEMLNDVEMISKPPKSEGDLAKNVSNLLAKVEMVENRTIEVEEELKSERRVRRHLEQEVKETQSSLISLGDQLHNVTSPMDEIMSHLQMVIYSSLEDMNKTIYEEHLQKLYYKVDGVVYQNETKKLDERLEHVETELHDGRNESLVTKLSEDVKNLEENVVVLTNTVGDELTPRMVLLESETLKRDTVEELEEKMASILNDTEHFKDGLIDVWSNIYDFKSFQQNVRNFSEEWAKSLENLKSQIEDLKNKTSARARGFDSYVVQDYDYVNDTNDVEIIDKVSSIVPSTTETNEIEENSDWDYGTLSEVAPSVDDKKRIVGVLLTDNDTCLAPVVNDSHLLVEIEEYSNERQTLIFGCHPIGRYIVHNGPIPLRCEMGSWEGPFPSCHQLPDEATIEQLAELLKKNHPCSSGLGEFPDPIDCTRFIKCAHGKIATISCPIGLHFNSLLKVCDYPNIAGCIRNESDLIKELMETIPPILIEPNNLDKPNGLLGTGPSGQLIVHPRSSVTLHCLYPESIWGLPTWDVIYSYPKTTSRSSILNEDRNRISLTVTAAKEEDSGTYRCITPFGKEHAIRVEVKAVHCPSIPLDEEFEEIFYRPTPEGEHRILGTTAEFPCEDGHRVVAVCMADGYWSRGLPDREECTLKQRISDSDWKCKPLDISRHPHLMFERNDIEKIVRFKCAGRFRLIGNSFTRCRDDGFWSHMTLPKCVH